jgi:hypothetical protein
MKLKPFLVLSIFLLTLKTSAQNNAINTIGGQIGILFSLGTHCNKIGLIGRVYWQKDFVQLNLQTAGWYNFKSLGSEKKAWEAQLQLGISGCWGTKRDSFSEINPFLNSVSNQTARPNAVSYAYIFYFDKMGSSQSSGIFGLQISNFRFYFENDFLAFQSKDKFRTGAMGFFYRYKDWQFALKHLAYTGDPYHKLCPWIEDGLFPSRSGFIDMTSAPLGNKSFGIISLQAERRIVPGKYIHSLDRMPLDQYLAAEIGVDAEQIRNFFQNKLIHDSKLLPLNWNDVKNPHIPMLCSDGCPYTYQDGQKIRKPRIFFQSSLNNSIFY